jgi:hypothetical protein
MTRKSRAAWALGCCVVSLILLSAFHMKAGGTCTGDCSPIQSPSTAQAPITGFGGYNWQGTVTSMSARWRVPTILPSSRPGYASTWIGVQTSVNSQGFIQLGTVEQEVGPEPSGSTAVSPRPPEYFAFWSDTQRDFFPVSLGPVAPGSLVSALMVKSSSGWKLTLSDNRRRLATGLPVRVSHTAPYNQAEWLQEDPAMTLAAGHDTPYPAISPVTFDGLVVNGRQPRLSFDDAQALSSSNGVFLVPSRFVDDSFTLVPAAGAAEQYLRDAISLDNANSQYDVALQSWEKDSPTTRRAVIQALVSAISTDRSAFANQAWPPSDQSLVDQVVKVQGAALGYLNFWLTSGGVATGNPPDIPPFDRVTPAADRLRSALGLPPL